VSPEALDFRLALADAPELAVEQGRYRARFATTPEELDAILRLRFEVFNLELGEGLEQSFTTERDVDRFDAVCHHLLVEEKASSRVIGTYRMQTLDMAGSVDGFYSAGEFRLEDLPPEVTVDAVELGRACIARDHRSRTVLFLLWRGLACYLASRAKRYAFGCCSLSSQNPVAGAKLYEQLERDGCVHRDLRVDPHADLRCVASVEEVRSADPVDLPQLFGTYLRYGAKVLGPPAIDRDFKTIDYFVIVDVESLDARTYRLFFS
jgi:putative hemolysin